MSDIGSEFELIWGATAAPFKPVAVQEPPWRQFKITRKRTPLQNEHIWLALLCERSFLIEKRLRRKVRHSGLLHVHARGLNNGLAVVCCTARAQSRRLPFPTDTAILARPSLRRRQYHTLSLGRLFKEKLLTIGDKCDGEPVVPVSDSRPAHDRD